MAQFSGKQFKGAKRVRKEQKRKEAETRQKRARLSNDKVMQALKNMTPEETDRFMKAAGLNKEAIGESIPLEDLVKELGLDN